MSARSLTRAGIIAVGSELLTPFRVDTNSLFVTDELNRLGIEVVLKAVVGDDRDQLAYMLRAALARVDLVVLSGGLGPTDDDVTREVAAGVLARPLTEDPARTAALRARFAARGLSGPMPDINRRQAMVPAGARVIDNPHGSAPGLWIDAAEQVVLLLPGPPRELQPMLEGLVSGWLAERAAGTPVVRRGIKIAGLVESQVEEAVQPLYRQWEGAAVPVAATILAQPGQVELHLSVRGTREVAESTLTDAVRQVSDRLGAHVFSVDGRSLEAVLGDALAERSFRIAVAESCTGGLLTSRLTDVAGSSRYVMQGVVAYTNDAKSDLLGVSPDLIAAHGAVSEAVARAMAAGIRARSGADIGLGITGIAGPGGGSVEKPVGTVAIAVDSALPDLGSQSKMFRFAGERDRVKFQASQAALDMARRLLMFTDAP